MADNDEVEFVNAVNAHMASMEATRAENRRVHELTQKIIRVDSYKLNPKQALYVPAGAPIPKLPDGTDDYMLRNGPTLQNCEIKPQALLKGEHYAGLWPDDIIEQIARQGFAIQTARD